MTNNEKTVVGAAQPEALSPEALSPQRPAAATPASPAQQGSEVEYQPMDYADPGAVTEQFDQLATRDPEQMLSQLGSGDLASGDTAEPPTTFSPEAAALAGGNETTHHNFGGAVSRAEGGDYDLADPKPQNR